MAYLAYAKANQKRTVTTTTVCFCQEDFQLPKWECGYVSDYLIQ